MVIMNNAQLQGQDYDSIYPPDGVSLQPFLHQVSGRAIMMCLNETTVCKPLNFREYYFYQSLPTDILQYTPQYKGVVNVNIEETKDGTIALTAFPSHNDENDQIDKKEENSQLSLSQITTTNKNNKNVSNDSCKRLITQVHSAGERSSRKRIRLKRTGSLCIERSDGSLDNDIEKSTQKPRFNPWTLKVYKEGLTRHLHSTNKVVQKCILLENVASRFKCPCILDLKMGTRVHGDFDDDAKRQRHLEKCAKSTTQSLGVRLAGMQVYRHESGTFLCRNKYFGRSLTVEGFGKTLREFFYNGYKMRIDLIQPIINNLRSLIKKLNKLPSYRFYSSSLLVMYDGMSEDVQNCGSDKISEKSNKDFSTKASDQDETLSSREDDDNIQSTENEEIVSGSESVDVRMIDFAKSTHGNMDASIIHKGPDKGYIFGLESLIEVLNNIIIEDLQ
uniref:inositol hexakisphosphate kinase 1-like n=1 Tax=Styela clava TaxID=7725 RepID=UPI00193A9B85|nr:inositol hexakisphosphate kinase 1-like [Styela clava]